MNFQDSSNREASMISSFQMILEDGSIHLNGEALRHRTWVLNSQCRMKFLSSKAMQKLLTSQLKTLLPHGFKLHLGTTRALAWEIHERSSKWNSLRYLNHGCHNKHLIRMKQFNAQEALECGF
ncbi:uncharacterized protein [Euphorbia lathyris]|uniref:uncharacterized protein isoform X2 n=1 Tax=Euphorbia lathyris TaxID=212925 RepID=UPI0033141ECA